ncbi:MAG: YgjP-like metallopeptidase domain-containing protein, partial [Steroidobacteraceae bacterium]
MSDAAAQSAQLGLLEEKGCHHAAWRVRASDRARRLSVRVFPGGQVEIVVPHGTRPRTVEQFVARYRSWIERKVAQYRPVEPSKDDGLPEVILFQASDDRWHVEYVEAKGAPRLTVADNRLRLIGDQSRVLLLRHALQ